MFQSVFVQAAAIIFFKGGIFMLVAIWVITFCLIIGIGVYAGSSIKAASQWSGGDRTLGAWSLGCVFAAWHRAAYQKRGKEIK